MIKPGGPYTVEWGLGDGDAVRVKTTRELTTGERLELHRLAAQLRAYSVGIKGVMLVQIGPRKNIEDGG